MNEKVFQRLPNRGTSFLEAVVAVNGFVTAWHKWHFGLSAALGAGDDVHFARTHGGTRSAFLRFTRRAAVGATAGFVLKTFGRKKLLFAGAKRKRCTAVSAGQ